MAEWAITLDTPADSSASTWNDLAKGSVKAFVKAFGDLLDPRWVSVDVVLLAEDGTAEGYVEDGAATLTGSGELHIPAGSMPAGHGEILIANVSIDCVVRPADRELNSAQLGRARFFYGSVFEDDDATRARPQAAEVRVAAEPERSSMVAEGDVGRPYMERLTKALREWEQLTGASISEYVAGNGTHSVVIRDLSDPSGEPISIIDRMAESAMARRLESGQWS
jgi:hypothetical protein